MIRGMRNVECGMRNVKDTRKEEGVRRNVECGMWNEKCERCEERERDREER